MTIILYGIPNCDTVKKARRWLDDRGISYSFHDYKKAGIAIADLNRWAGEVGWEKLLNRSGTTFRKLDDSEKANIDTTKAIALMAAYPSIIKRPVIEGAGPLLVGFGEPAYEAVFGR